MKVDQTREAANVERCLSMLLPLTIAWLWTLVHVAVEGKLIFSEIHFAGRRVEETEFVEIFNAGNQTVPLAGVTLESGIEFTFPTADARAIAPQTYIVVVQNVRCQGATLPFFFFFFFSILL
jgi:hypothetical protein